MTPTTRLRTVTLVPTFTNPLDDAAEPQSITGYFIGKTSTHWFVRVDGETKDLSVENWKEAK